MAFKKFHYLKEVAFFVSVFSIFVAFAHVAIATDKQELLKIVRSFDEAYEKGISTSGNHSSTSPPIFRGQTRNQVLDYAWSYTQTDKQKAAFETSKIMPQPDIDEEIIYNRQLLLFDTKRSGKKLIRLLPEVPLLNYAVSQDVLDAVLSVHAPDSDVLSLQIDLFLFALGRGGVGKIDLLDESSDSIDRNGEKCLWVTGQGESMSSRGRWEFYLLPDSAYMIRQAKFLQNNNVLLEVETFGLKRNGDCFYPKNSEIKIPIGNKSIVHQFVFHTAKLEFDSELFDRVVREFDAELMDGALKMDSSSGKDTIQLIGGEKLAATDSLLPSPAFRRFFVVGINLLGIALLLYLYRRNRQKKMEQNASSSK